MMMNEFQHKGKVFPLIRKSLYVLETTKTDGKCEESMRKRNFY